MKIYKYIGKRTLTKIKLMLSINIIQNNYKEHIHINDRGREKDQHRVKIKTNY